MYRTHDKGGTTARKPAEIAFKKYTGARAKAVIALLVAVLAVGAAVILTRERQWDYTATAMGTHVRISLVGTPMERLTGKLDRLSEGALADIHEIEDLMSLYKEGSDVQRLNSGGAEGEVAVDARTFEVLQAAMELSELTGGAFNICVLPAERSWGFKRPGERRVPSRGGQGAPGAPSDVSLSSAGENYHAGFLKPGIEIDLGGIAKGYAVDRAVTLLRNAGVRGALVDIGGDCYCLGRDARGGPWRVGLRHPRAEGILTTLELVDKAVATSGDYEDYFFEGGRRYSHIFDPRTGRPADSGVASATVICDSCMIADALATSLAVMGSEKGIGLVEELQGTECIIISEDGDSLVVSASSGKR